MFHPETVRAEEPLRYKAVLAPVLQAETYLPLRALSKETGGSVCFRAGSGTKGGDISLQSGASSGTGGNEDASGGKVSIIAASGGSFLWVHGRSLLKWKSVSVHR